MLFDKVIAFDNLKQKIIVIVNAKTDNLEVTYPQAVPVRISLIRILQTKN